jgi:hypothetical protein
MQNQFGLQQQNFPYQQLQFANQQLSGLPITSQLTTGTNQGVQQGTQAGPSTLSSLLGLGTSLGGAALMYKALGLKEGGQVHSYANGGLINSGLNDIRLHQLLG